MHPGLIPGIGVERTGARFPTSWAVLITAVSFAVLLLIWALVDPVQMQAAGTGIQGWVISHFGWLFGALVVTVLVFMLVIGYGPTGDIKLGRDDEDPEYSTFSWISMLFAAGLGIGLIFYGPLEPLSHLLQPPPGSTAEPGTMDAVLPSMAHVAMHHGIFAWAIYGLVAGAIAYSSYRRGRLPLISAVFEPIFPGGHHRVAGRIIDIFAVLVTLFGTATSLGIGALQIRTGYEIVTGLGPQGNAFLIGAITLLTVIFVFSAVSGVKRGIRWLSNINMFLVGFLGLFALVLGPTIFILNLFPATIFAFFTSVGEMLTINASQGQAETEFLLSWTTLYWAWWLSWSPFVGMFIAKISRGRSIREFVTTVVLVPAAISIAWFTVYGGNAMWLALEGREIQRGGSGESVMFEVLSYLPFSGLTWVIVMVAVVVFFTTAADSATLVMGSMTQGGRTRPTAAIIVTLGALLGAVALSLLLAGGREALSGLQAVMVTTSLPFVVVFVGIMVSWAKDLRTDPLMIRRRYARIAIAEGVRRGIGEHGDDFVFGTEHVPSDQGAGAAFDSEDPALSDWYTTHSMSGEADDGPGEEAGEAPGRDR